MVKRCQRQERWCCCSTSITPSSITTASWRIWESDWSRRILADTLTTVFVRQGHYALEASNTAIDPAPDVSIQRIGELLDLDLPDFLRGVAPTRTANLQQE